MNAPLSKPRKTKDGLLREAEELRAEAADLREEAKDREWHADRLEKEAGRMAEEDPDALREEVSRLLGAAEMGILPLSGVGRELFERYLETGEFNTALGEIMVCHGTHPACFR